MGQHKYQEVYLSSPTTEVAVQNSLQLDIGNGERSSVRSLAQQSVDAHDDTGCAETALRAAKLPHALLERVRVLRIAESCE